MERKYRVCFSPNGLEPFTFNLPSYDVAMTVLNELAKFDLEQSYDNSNKVVEDVVTAYKAYRRKHGINHPSMIQFSTGTVDVLVDGVWYIAESECEEDENGNAIEELEPYMESFN